VRVALVAVGEEHRRDLLRTLGVELGRIVGSSRLRRLALPVEPQRERVEPAPERGIRSADVVVHERQVYADQASRPSPGARPAGYPGRGPASIDGIASSTGVPFATVNAFPWCESSSGSPETTS
jgi:hypothetical protein